MAEINIIENSSEIGAGTRGASLGIDALKVVARNRKSSYFGDYERFIIEDQNDLLDEKTEFNFAKRIDGLLDVFTNTKDVLDFVFSQGNFPIVLSGDHACAAGTIIGIKVKYPTKRLGVIWIDAHADLHTPYTTPSGNVHGMPLAIVLNIDNLDSKVNQPSKEGVECWEELKNLGGIAPKILAEDIVFISVRDTEKPEDDFIKRNAIKNYTVDEVRALTKEHVVDQIKERLSHCDLIYVSFDVDSMDCVLVSKGTGTPVENGLTPAEADYFVSEFAGWNKTCCVEMVEINPCLDNKTNRMAEVAFDILENFTQRIEKRI